MITSIQCDYNIISYDRTVVIHCDIIRPVLVLGITEVNKQCTGIVCRTLAQLALAPLTKTVKHK